MGKYSYEKTHEYSKEETTEMIKTKYSSSVPELTRPLCSTKAGSEIRHQTSGAVPRLFDRRMRPPQGASAPNLHRHAHQPVR